jgi:hypothetical protein
MAPAVAALSVFAVQRRFSKVSDRAVADGEPRRGDDASDAIITVLLYIMLIIGVMCRGPEVGVKVPMDWPFRVTSGRRRSPDRLRLIVFVLGVPELLDKPWRGVPLIQLGASAAFPFTSSFLEPLQEGVSARLA